jgi:sortase (surface protein transpeptidase)
MAMAVSCGAAAAAQGATARRSPPPKPAPSAQPAIIPPTAALPVRIQIPSIDLNTQLTQLAVNSTDQPSAPPNPWVPGWYPASPAPGDVGPAIIAGHLDTYTGPAIFWRLSQVQVGDTILISRADGTTITFDVYRIQAVSQQNFPSQEVYGPTPFPELRLLTCAGTWNSAIGKYSQNLVVFGRLSN